jgi:hypothetical protein
VPERHRSASTSLTSRSASSTMACQTRLLARAARKGRVTEEHLPSHDYKGVAECRVLQVPLSSSLRHTGQPKERTPTSAGNV